MAWRPSGADEIGDGQGRASHGRLVAIAWSNDIDEGVSLCGSPPPGRGRRGGGVSNTSRPARRIRHTPRSGAASGGARCDIRTRRAPTAPNLDLPPAPAPLTYILKVFMAWRRERLSLLFRMLTP